MAIRFDKLRYTVLMPGLQIPDEIYITLDGDYFLYHKEHPPSPLFIARKDYRNISQETLDYYADCLAYLHDQPTLIIYENDRRLQSRPLLRAGHKSTRLNDNYYASVYSIYERLLDKRLNGSVLFFNEEALAREVNIDLSNLLQASRELRLYNAALKQTEPYIEFFMYCRVLEMICNGLNKKWLARNLTRIPGFDFHKISVFSHLDDVREDKKIDYMRLLVRRFSARIRQLETQRIDLPDYYFEEIRNSIAHGSRNAFEFRGAQRLEEDCAVIKLLCRFGIQRKSGHGKSAGGRHEA